MAFLPQEVDQFEFVVGAFADQPADIAVGDLLGQGRLFIGMVVFVGDGLSVQLLEARRLRTLPRSRKESAADSRWPRAYDSRSRNHAPDPLEIASEPGAHDRQFAGLAGRKVGSLFRVLVGHFSRCGHRRGPRRAG